MCQCHARKRQAPQQTTGLPNRVPKNPPRWCGLQRSRQLNLKVRARSWGLKRVAATHHQRDQREHLHQRIQRLGPDQAQRHCAPLAQSRHAHLAHRQGRCRGASARLGTRVGPGTALRSGDLRVRYQSERRGRAGDEQGLPVRHRSCSVPRGCTERAQAAEHTQEPHALQIWPHFLTFTRTEH